MAKLMDSGGVQRLEAFFDRVGRVLANKRRRASLAIYMMGLLGDGERKSIEPIACRACTDPQTADAAHQRLLHFATDSGWSDRAVRREAASYVLAEMLEREPVDAWIVDDTGFLKQGKYSVGVQRQYTGSAGKVTNCQIGVSLSVATGTEHAPIDFELYLPQSWTSDPIRRREARIPDEVQFRTKPQLALDMIRRAVEDGVPKAPVLADSGYGSSAEFRRELRALDLDYAVGVNSTTLVWRIEQSWDPATAISVRELALSLRFRRCTWRKGTREDLSAKFAMARVLVAREDAKSGDREPLWLLVEWRDGEAEPANYFFSSLSARISKKHLIRLAMQRWRTERVYQDLKDELGLDHFEGRRFSGWHHHVSIALCCYAFVIAERVRHFPPSARGSVETHALSSAA